MLKQPWAKNILEFKQYFHKTLEFITQKSEKVITVPPLFVGENLNNIWNQEIIKLSEVILEESSQYDNVSFVNLRDSFKIKPANNNQDYIAKHALRVAMDALLLKKREDVDKKSSYRGLFYTLDGIHLNSRGAELVSNIFHKIIADSLY